MKRALAFVLFLGLTALVLSKTAYPKRKHETNYNCGLKFVAGPCKAYFPVFYFDSKKNKCVSGVYGGCLGNRNRFRSIEKCQKACVKTPVPVVEDVCKLPFDAGTCLALVPVYYFDHERGKCVGATYGGCKGNGNRFRTSEECENACGSGVRPVTRAPHYEIEAKGPIYAPIPTQKPENVCELEFDGGTCKAYIPVFYFDSKKDKCVSGVYGGCEGNGNNFGTIEKCQKACVKTPVKDACKATVVAPLCLARSSVYYFDQEHGKCMGAESCAIHGKVFGTAEKCEKTCGSARASTIAPHYEIEVKGPIYAPMPTLRP